MIIKVEMDNLEMYTIGIWIINWNVSFCNRPHWEAQSPRSKCRHSFADALRSDWNPKGQTSRTARRSQCTFRNYNRSCWLLHSCKPGLYLRFARIQSRFSFNQLKRQFSAWYCQMAPLILGAHCAKFSPPPKKKPHYRHIAQWAELKFKGLNFKLAPNLL